MVIPGIQMKPLSEELLRDISCDYADTTFVGLNNHITIKERALSYVAVASAIVDAVADTTTQLTAIERTDSTKHNHDHIISKYTFACENLMSEPSVSTFDNLSSTLKLGMHGDIGVELLEHGMIICSNFLASGESRLSIMAQCLVLRHWLISPTYVPAANPEVIMSCFRGLREFLESNRDITYGHLCDLLMLWSQVVEHECLDEQQRLYLFTIIVECGFGGENISMRKYTVCALRIPFSIFIISSEHTRLILANLLVDLWFRDAIATEYVSIILTMFVAISGQSNSSEWMKAHNTRNWQIISSLAHDAHSKAVGLAKTVAKQVIKRLLTKGVSKISLVNTLIDNYVRCLWTEQIASAEPLLSALAAELQVNLRAVTGFSNGEEILAITAHMNESLWFLLGVRTQISFKRLLTAARTKDQILYLAVRLCDKEESPHLLYDTVLKLFPSPIGALLLPSEWREFVLSSPLLECYRTISHYLMGLVLYSSLSNSLQVSIFRSFERLVKHDPRFFPVVLLERLTYSSERVCEALIPLASAAIHRKHPQSLKILSSLGTRLVTSGLKSYKVAMGKFLCEAVRVSDATCQVSFLLMLTILVDPDRSLWKVVSDTAQKTMIEDILAHINVKERSYEILRAVASSQDFVKTGLRTLTALMSSAQIKHLDLLMYELCQTNELDLISLLSQFCDVRVPSEYIVSTIESLELASTSKRTIQLSIIASALTKEYKYCSIDPLSSHSAFTKLYYAFSPCHQYNANEVDYIAMSLHSLIGMCHPKVQEQRKAAMQQFVDTLFAELSKFKSQEKDMFSRKHQYFSRMVQLLGCYKFWTFIKTPSVVEVINLLIYLSDKTALGSYQSCLLVHAIFSIINYRRIPESTKSVVLKFTSEIIYSIPETDTLIEIILLKRWQNGHEDFQSPLSRGGYFGLNIETRLLERLLHSESLFQHRSKFEFLSQILYSQPILQDFCVPKLISFCFAHHAVTAQWALESYTRIRKQKKPANTKIILGLKLASNLQRRHIGPFPRVWELTMLNVKESEALDLLEQLVSEISLDGSNLFPRFLFDGILRTSLDPLHGIWLKEKLSVMIARLSMSETDPVCNQCTKLHIMQKLENWLVQRYPSSSSVQLKSNA